jgi:hypothetical protein
MKRLTEIIAELDAMRHGKAIEVVQKVAEALKEIDNRISKLESSKPIS